MELHPIGRFARLTGLTVRAIRHYGELGLLEPAYVDPHSGYRYFTSDQVEDAAAIRRLRFLELALDEIREIVATDDPGFTRARLVQHRAKMAELAATTEQILASLQRIIDGEEKLVPTTGDIRSEIEIRDVPEQPVLLIRDRKPVEEMSSVIPAAIGEVHAHLEALGAAFVGPPLVVCPYADDEGMVDIEIGWPVSDEIAGKGRIGYTTLPAKTMLTYRHCGPYYELDRSYRALQAVVESEGLSVIGSPREIYWTDPEDVPDPADWITEIQFPIDDDAAASALRAVS